MADTHLPDGDHDRASQVSVTSTAMIEREEYLRQEAGRSYNVLNDSYFLPTDDEEFARLNKQHLALKLALSGLYTAPEVVEVILAKRDGEKQKILDVGCGTGVWAVAMAKAFPHCEVVGIDLAPVPLGPEAIPPNCRFELDDVNKELPHYYNQFSVVHARFIAGGLRDFKKCKGEIERCLEPGGIMLWMDGDYDMCTKDKAIYRAPASDAHPDGSWLARMIFEMRRTAVRMGRSDIFTMIETLSLGLWNDELLDPETCGAADLFMPLDPNPLQNQRLHHIGTLMRQDFSSGHKAFHVPFQKVGISAETCNEWSGLADKDLNEMKKPLLVRFPCAWGRRRAGPGEAAPPLPSSSSKADIKENLRSSLPPYPYFDVFQTKEQAKEAYERRNKTKTFTPPPNPPGLQV
ncbi:SubName: Full=Related to methyltransferase {ECO:0000313/EMBL:CCA71907.1} [Serendipita indica DSM 11827]|nr:SubName: Full=Related to methyltransferase {ECO:0000313/EMBL:CCA71907.1} [Serendipita indica DSM 11827]